MKFIALKSNVKEAISVVERAVGENTNLPILKNILIDVQKGMVVFSATNLEMAVSCKVVGKVIEEGKLTIPLSLFSGIINNIQSDRLNFEKKGNDLEVATDSYSAKVHGMGAEDFPVTPEVKGGEGYIQIKSAFLKEAIQQVVVAAQFSDFRPELNSVLFSYSVEDIKFAATDGFRLAEKTIPANLFEVKKIDEPFKMLIPLKTASEVSRVLKDEETVVISRDENQVLFKADGVEFVSRLVEGGFPDYSAIIPHKFAAEIAVNKNEFANAIKLTGIFGQKSSEVTIKINANKKAIEISSADQALGENNYVLPAKVSGDAQETCFNWRYLADPIKGLRSEDIFLGMQEDSNPALIRATDDTSYFYILKPILKA